MASSELWSQAHLDSTYSFKFGDSGQLKWLHYPFKLPVLSPGNCFTGLVIMYLKSLVDYLAPSMRSRNGQSVQSGHSVVSNSLWPHGLRHARLLCPSPNPGACSNPRPSSQWCHPTISSSVIPFSSCLQSFPASWSFPMSQFFALGGQSIGASASVLPMKIQCLCPLGLTSLISLQSKGLSRVFSNTTVQKHQFFGTQPF